MDGSRMEVGQEADSTTVGELSLQVARIYRSSDSDNDNDSSDDESPPKERRHTSLPANYTKLSSTYRKEFPLNLQAFPKYLQHFGDPESSEQASDKSSKIQRLRNLLQLRNQAEIDRLAEERELLAQYEESARARQTAFVKHTKDMLERCRSGMLEMEGLMLQVPAVVWDRIRQSRPHYHSRSRRYQVSRLSMSSPPVPRRSGRSSSSNENTFVTWLLKRIGATESQANEEARLLQLSDREVERAIRKTELATQLRGIVGEDMLTVEDAVTVISQHGDNVEQLASQIIQGELSTEGLGGFGSVVGNVILRTRKVNMSAGTIEVEVVLDRNGRPIRGGFKCPRHRGASWDSQQQQQQQQEPIRNIGTRSPRPSARRVLSGPLGLFRRSPSNVSFPELTRADSTSGQASQSTGMSVPETQDDEGSSDSGSSRSDESNVVDDENSDQSCWCTNPHVLSCKVSDLVTASGISPLNETQQSRILEIYESNIPTITYAKFLQDIGQEEFTFIDLGTPPLSPFTDYEPSYSGENLVSLKHKKDGNIMFHAHNASGFGLIESNVPIRFYTQIVNGAVNIVHMVLNDLNDNVAVATSLLEEGDTEGMDLELVRAFETDATGVALSYRIVAMGNRIEAVLYRVGDEVKTAKIEQHEIPAVGQLVVVQDGRIGVLESIPTGLVAGAVSEHDEVKLTAEVAPETHSLRMGVRHFSELPGLVQVKLLTDQTGNWLETPLSQAWPVECVRVGGAVETRRLDAAKEAFDNSVTERTKRIEQQVAELEELFARVSAGNETSEDFVHWTTLALEKARVDILELQEDLNCFDAKRLAKLWRGLRAFNFARRSRVL